MAIHVSSAYSEAVKYTSNCTSSIRLYTNNEKLITRFYNAEYRRYSDGRTSMTFECLYNYYLIEGDLEMFCINNNFVGVEPKCRVRPFMEKASLSFFIALVSFSIPAIWLAVDFGIFVHLRRKRRSVSFSPIAKRGRINVLKCRDSVGEHIVRDIMNYISATDLDKKSEQPGGKMYGYGNHEDAEDIFANKTGVRRHGSKKSVQDGKEFELLGAARAFGKIGKILEKNLF